MKGDCLGHSDESRRGHCLNLLMWLREGKSLRISLSLSGSSVLIEGHCPNSELLLLLVFIINNLVKEIIKIMSLG